MECCLLFLIPFREAVQVTRPVDESVWVVHEMMRWSIVSSAIGDSKWGSVLLGENETVLLSLDVLRANIGWQVVRIDHVASVLSQGSTSNIIDVWVHCWLRP